MCYFQLFFFDQGLWKNFRVGVLDWDRISPKKVQNGWWRRERRRSEENDANTLPRGYQPGESLVCCGMSWVACIVKCRNNILNAVINICRTHMLGRIWPSQSHTTNFGLWRSWSRNWAKNGAFILTKCKWSIWSWDCSHFLLLRGSQHDTHRLAWIDFGTSESLIINTSSL